MVATETPRERQIREALATRERQVARELPKLDAMGEWSWLAATIVNEQMRASGDVIDGGGRWRSQLVSWQRVWERAVATYGEDGVSQQTFYDGMSALKQAGLIDVTGTSFRYVQWRAPWEP